MLEIWNYWWKEGFVRKELLGKRRGFFYEIIKYLNKRQIIAIKGQRRVGKTTLLYQIIDYLLIEKKVNKFNILYYSFDEEIKDVNSVIEEYEKNVLKNKISGFEKIYIFFDEIQKFRDFSNKLKILYDLNPNIKIFISGSSSLEIDIGYKENLAGRCIEFILKPLSFKEYLAFKNINYELDRIRIYQKDLEIELNKYILNSGMIEVLNELDEEFLRKYFFDSILNRIIYYDILKSFKISEPELLIQIFKIISSKPGMLINYQNLSNELGRDRRTIDKYVNFLKNSLLINVIYNFSKNFSKIEKKLKKAYPQLTFYTYIISKEILNLNENIPFIFETILLNNFQYKFFYRSPSKKEIDFINLENNKITPIELKYKDNIKLSDLNNLIYFLNKFNLKDGYIITKNIKKTEKIENKIINFIPFIDFLLKAD